MTKKALCIEKYQADLPIDRWTPALYDRDFCETNEEVLQVIPYITLVDINTNAVFSYTRGKAGQENRLHSKVSIGLGGHIESKLITDIYDLIALEAIREVKEEVGLTCDYKAIKRDLIDGNYRVLYTPKSYNQVDRVHIGLAIKVMVDKNNLTELEAGVILEPAWLTVGHLTDLVKLKNIKLENWSFLFGQELLTEFDSSNKSKVQLVNIVIPPCDDVHSIVLDLTKETAVEQLQRWEHGSAPLFGYSELNGAKNPIVQTEKFFGRHLGPASICTLGAQCIANIFN